MHDNAGRAEQAGVAAQQPGGELEVVVPQEVVGLRQTALPAHAGVDQHRYKRCRTDRHAARGRGRGPFCPAGERLDARGVHRVRPPVGPDHAAGHQRRRPAGQAPAGLEQRAQGVPPGHRVVVHEPDEVRAARQGQRHAAGEPARPAGVARKLGQRRARVARADRRGGPVRRGVVDHDHRVGHAALRIYRRERLEQQLPAVVGDHDGGHGGRVAPGRPRILSFAHARDVPAVRAAVTGLARHRAARGPGHARAPARPRCAAAGRPGSGC